jgi:AraC-like DNA-binding protein
VTGLDFELPSVVPAGLCAYAFSRDVPPEELFAATGLSPEVLGDPEKPVRAAVMMPLWRFLLERFPNEPITLSMAAGMDFSFLGLAGQMVRHSSTVRAALERTLRFQKLYDPGLYTTFSEADGRATYGIGHVDEVRKLGAPIEFMAAVSLHYFRQLVGEPISVLEVSLETQPRGDPEAYVRYFGGSVRFGQPQTLMVLDAALLDRPVTGADPGVLRYLSAYAEGLLAKLPDTEVQLPLADRVRRAIERGMAHGDIGPEAIARQLAMGSRTLQRRLAGAGTSFQTLADAVRREAALRLLASEATPIQEVAFVLGYQDVPSFYRAFKRWTGKTPAEQRRELCG